MKNLLIVFFGGGLGSLMRYFVNRWVSGVITVLYPSGTLVANITGCFLIGFFIFYTERLGPNALNWRLFLVTGLCGGYTTFSSFSFEKRANDNQSSNIQYALLHFGKCHLRFFGYLYRDFISTPHLSLKVRDEGCYLKKNTISKKNSNKFA